MATENKKELILAIGSEPDEGFDPTTGWGRYGSPLFQSTLLKRNNDMEIVKDLATEYSVSDDGLVWTVTIRDDVKFSDSTSLTAHDVVFTYQTAQESSSVVDLTVMDRVEALDDYTVQFTLKKPQSTFVNLLVTLGIVPKDSYSSDYGQNPIGSGPFKFVQWDKGQQLIVEANPEYYGAKPYFEKLTFLYLSEETAFAAARAGQVDVAAIVPAFANQQVPGMRLLALESVDNRGIMFPYTMEGNKTEEGHPIGNAVTSDLAIRKAINVAIDREALVEGILNGYGSPAYSVSDKMPWWNPDTVIQDGNLEEAKKILADGQWEDRDGDGIVEKGSLKAEFTLIYSASDNTRQSLAIAVADQLKQIGIKVNVEGKSWDEIKKQMHSNAVVFGWGSHDPLEMYHLYHSKYRGVSWYNTGYYANDLVDKYLDKALTAKDEETANQYWQKAQWDGSTGFSAKGDAPWAWLVNHNHLYLVKENLYMGQQKIQPHGHGWPLTDNIEAWRWEN
ncbi:ABC transporter substrate-binding protein [Heliorestis acidaminivorans]|uniref:ABC transporter substrate-binding protein n=2 Tax=Heliorestis acidaminivorans TaxID=553427 RepID=A0A6I0F4J9_9FIRM|nr:ABC transporter substrate-binding protein [Heliorestis acidaminivorans]